MRQFYYTLRTLMRGRSSTGIKLISLTLGLLIGILLFSQIAYELNYERCYPEADRLVQIRALITNMKTGERMGDDGSSYDGTIVGPMAPALAEDLREWVQSATVIFPAGEDPLFIDDRTLDARYIYADTCFFRTMGIPVLQGNPDEMIRENTAFVSRRFARRYFGSEDVVGKIISRAKKSDITIRGVYQDMADNSMLQHDLVLSIHEGDGYRYGAGWNGNDIFYGILRLKHATDVDAVNANIQRAVERHTSTEMQGWKIDYSVIPLPDRHLDNPDTVKRLVILGFLGFAIFFVAAMNYILISIAALSRRAKAVGVHKCSGASAGNIFSMFLMETGIIVLLAAVLSVVLMLLFADLIEVQLGVALTSLFTGQTLWVPVLVVLLLVVVAGVLPGRMFSRIPVTQIFRRYTDGKKGWKSGLLFIQFTGVAFVLGLLVVTLMQYSMLMNRDMGIRVEGLVEGEGWLPKEQYESIRDYIRRQPMVEGVGMATSPVLGEYWTRGLTGNDGKRIATLNFNYVSKEYADVMGIRLLEGKPLMNPGDVWVNEEVVRLMKWTDGAIGKHLNDFEKTGAIVGVFANVRNTGFYAEQAPIALIYNTTANHAFDVRLRKPYDENLQRLNEFMRETFPQVAITFRSVQSQIAEMYEDVYRFRNSVYITSVFILLIVLMGLIGYVNDETQRRAKEIAIRKVNGAETRDVLILLSRDILRVAFPSVLIGAAVAWYVGVEWLRQFAEQITLNPLLFVGLAIVVLALIVLVVILKAWRIAVENPVLSLKSE